MFERLLPPDKDLLPLTWWKQHPIYLSAILAIGAAASMVMFAILGYTLMLQMSFSIDAIATGKLWTPVTYVLVNPPGIGTVVGCYLLWRFGEAVERHFGRRIFVKMLLMLVVVSPLTIALLHLTPMRGYQCAGINDLEFAVFIAFATLYPRAEINLFIITLEAWILASVLVAVSALVDLASRDWGSLILLSANVGSAYLFVRYQKGEIQLPALRLRSNRKKRTDRSAALIDEILEKVHREGMQSLTTKEREMLERASRGK
jgi:hypothetical protein